MPLSGIRNTFCMSMAAMAVGAFMAAGPVAAASERLVRFDAVIADGGEPVYDAMAIAVWRLQDGTPVERVAERHAAPAEVTLDPGGYRIEAIYGNARTVTDVMIPIDGAAKQLINLNAGQVKLNLVPGVNGSPITRDVDWEVRRYRHGDELGRKVAESSQGQPQLWLTEGWYEVFAKHNEHTVKHVVEVAAGQNYNYSIILDQ